MADRALELGQSGQGLPTGRVTFLFTDIEGSTKLAQNYPDEMPALLARHHELLRKAQEQGERAVKLMSAAEALREASSSSRTPRERVEYDRELEGLRAGMDEETFNLLWADGRAMTMEQAIELALTQS